MAYEWMWGTLAVSGDTLVNQTCSEQLKDNFAGYLADLDLKGINDYGTLTSGNYASYLTTQYLEPSATKYLAALSDSAREEYLNWWIRTGTLDTNTAHRSSKPSGHNVESR